MIWLGIGAVGGVAGFIAVTELPYRLTRRNRRRQQARDRKEVRLAVAAVARDLRQVRDALHGNLTSQAGVAGLTRRTLLELCSALRSSSGSGGGR